MAKRDFIATYSDTHTTITIKRSAAKRAALLIEDAGDWFGNTDPADLGLTAKQFSAAEDDITHLGDLLNGPLEE